MVSIFFPNDQFKKNDAIMVHKFERKNNYGKSEEINHAG